MTLPLSINTRIGQAILFSPGLPVALTSFQLTGAIPFYAQCDSFGHIIFQQITKDRFTAWISHYIITRPQELSCSRTLSEDITERELPITANEKYREQKTGELIIESLDMLSRYLTDHNGLNPADHERGARTEILLLQHIHHPSPPTLKQLAKFAGTNEKKLEDIFRCRHGITVYDFFQNARMKIIHRKLTETAIPLQDLAEEFGYTDYSSFSYAVKKRFSAGPRELRKNSNLV